MNTIMRDTKEASEVVERLHVILGRRWSLEQKRRLIRSRILGMTNTGELEVWADVLKSYSFHMECRYAKFRIQVLINQGARCWKAIS